MSNSISWIDNKWGSINELQLPIADRGLNYSDGIFETILIWKGKVKLLQEHLLRWNISASKLDMASPPKESWLIPLIEEAIDRASLNEGNGALRLNWSRGNKIERNINISKNNKHRFWMELNPSEPSFSSISTIISSYEKRNANSKLSQCKTFSYGQAISARREAQAAGYDDALLESTTGGICCGTTANLIVKRKDEILTPPLKSGCLPGIMRAQGLKKGILKEAVIEVNPNKADEWLLINSLSCKSINKVNQINLSITPANESLWQSLYEI